jgi:hypothetical protein
LCPLTVHVQIVVIESKMNVTFYNFTLTVINSIVTTYIFVGLVEFNATFNNILAILWRSALLVEKTTDLSPVTDKFYHIMLYTTL